MADGDSASCIDVEKKQSSESNLCDVAINGDLKSSPPSVVNEDAETKEKDSNKVAPDLHAMDTEENDMTKFCKDNANAVIHSIINIASESENSEGNDSSITEVQGKPSEANASALSQLCAYDSDSDQSVTELSSPLQSEEIVEIRNNHNYRSSQPVLSDSEEDSEEDSDEYLDDSSSTTSSSSATSSSSTAVASSDDSDSDSDAGGLPPPPKPDIVRSEVPRTLGELSIDELPPIEDLHISVAEQECTELGHIESIVDTLVVVQAKKNSPALDLDSVLFLDQGKRPLGRVFDVFGPVNEPCYCVRFNSADHIREKKIDKGLAVYCAPRTEFSSYVFLPDLLKIKGSDASWENNNEPPPKFLDYSDDEEERRVRRADRTTNREFKEEDPDQPSRKRRTRYEQLMNSRNLRMSAINPPVSSSSSCARNPWGGPWGLQSSGASIFRTPPPGTHPVATSSPAMLIRPPSFSVPPPKFGTVPPPPPPMFSSPPPAFPPVVSRPYSSLDEHPVIPEYDPSLPPPPIQSPSPSVISSQFNFPPPSVPNNIEKLSSNLFNVPPPPPLPVMASLPHVPPPSLLTVPPPLPQMAFLSTPPPQPPPAHW